MNPEQFLEQARQVLQRSAHRMRLSRLRNFGAELREYGVTAIQHARRPGIVMLVAPDGPWAELVRAEIASGMGFDADRSEKCPQKN